MIIRRGRPLLAAGLGMAAGAAISRSRAAQQPQTAAQNNLQQSAQQEDPTDDVMKKIQGLAQLHKDGILTDTEFETKKAELLKQL